MSNNNISNAFKNIKEHLKKQETTALKDLSFQLMSRVMQKTPVRTGRARAGWRHFDKSPFEQHVYNQVEYIVSLEYGKSRQAPAGMVRISLAELKNELRNQ